MKLTLEDVQKKIAEVGDFSPKLSEVLLYILKDLQDVRSLCTQENEIRKAELVVKKYCFLSFKINSLTNIFSFEINSYLIQK